MSQNNSQKDPSPHINITPLIDVLLVLLIIFMVVAPLRANRFEAKIPSEPKIDDLAQANINSLVVTIDKNLQIKLNKEDLGNVSETGKLSSRLLEVFRLRTENGVLSENLAARNDLSEIEKIEKTVFIKAPRSIAYGEVIKIVDAVKGAGATPIGLQIDDLSE